MKTMCSFLSRLSGSLGVLCLVLAVLASPRSAYADEEDLQSQCGNGTPECAIYVAQGDCEPTGGNKCNNSHVNCRCKWRLVARSDGTGSDYKCVCNSTVAPGGV